MKLRINSFRNRTILFVCLSLVLTNNTNGQDFQFHGRATGFGLALALYFQEKGLDMSGQFKNSTLMVNNMIKAKIRFTSYYIGFIPGLLATLTGTSLSGIQIFKRQTASLFKELES
jgi:hypothetical protein